MDTTRNKIKLTKHTDNPTIANILPKILILPCMPCIPRVTETLPDATPNIILMRENIVHIPTEAELNNVAMPQMNMSP